MTPLTIQLNRTPNIYNPFSPQELVAAIPALPCHVSAIVYCHRINSPPIFDRFSRSFLTVHAVRHLLSHRKLKNNALLRKYSELYLDIRMFLLISQHNSQLRQLRKNQDSTSHDAHVSENNNYNSQRNLHRFNITIACSISIPVNPARPFSAAVTTIFLLTLQIQNRE